MHINLHIHYVLQNTTQHHDQLDQQSQRHISDVRSATEKCYDCFARQFNVGSISWRNILERNYDWSTIKFWAMTKNQHTLFNANLNNLLLFCLSHSEKHLFSISTLCSRLKLITNVSIIASTNSQQSRTTPARKWRVRVWWANNFFLQHRIKLLIAQECVLTRFGGWNNMCCFWMKFSNLIL